MGEAVELGILFADVVGSTRLYERLGDLRARETVAIGMEVMRAATEQHLGRVIKTMGDEVMATFPAADLMVNAAARMHRQISEHPQLHVGEQALSIRVGCHFGAVVLEGGDVFGSAVHIASRLTNQAKGGQILTTTPTVERLPAEWQTAARRIDIAPIKGFASQVVVHELLWLAEGVTGMVPAFSTETPIPQNLRLRLRVQQREIVVDEHRPVVSIGRAQDNDIVMEGNLISRLHARIELSRNKFVLIDQSTNGTFVQTESGEKSFVRRDTVQIRDAGMIGLGRLPQPESPQTISFHCGEGQ